MTRQDDRAVSDVIGFVLVFSLVITTVAIVTVSGIDSLQDVRDAEQATNVERAFDVLADNMEDILQEGAPSRSTEIDLQDAQLDTGSSVTINVSGETSGGDIEQLSGDTTVAPIVWESTQTSDREIVYALGAVLRSERDGGVVLRDPPFVLRDDRILMPILNTRALEPTSRGGSTIRVRASKTGSNATEFGSTDYDKILVNITSPRADIWKQYFERKDITTDCDLNTGVDPNRAECRLDGPDELYLSVHAVEIELEG